MVLLLTFFVSFATATQYEHLSCMELFEETISTQSSSSSAQEQALAQHLEVRDYLVEEITSVLENFEQDLHYLRSLSQSLDEVSTDFLIQTIKQIIKLNRLSVFGYRYYKGIGTDLEHLTLIYTPNGPQMTRLSSLDSVYSNLSREEKQLLQLQTNGYNSIWGQVGSSRIATINEIYRELARLLRLRTRLSIQNLVSEEFAFFSSSSTRNYLQSLSSLNLTNKISAFKEQVDRQLDAVMKEQISYQWSLWNTSMQPLARNNALGGYDEKSLILTPGGYKSVAEIKVGDKVFSFDHTSRSFIENTVEAIRKFRGFSVRVQSHHNLRLSPYLYLFAHLLEEDDLENTELRLIFELFRESTRTEYLNQPTYHVSSLNDRYTDIATGQALLELNPDSGIPVIELDTLMRNFVLKETNANMFINGLMVPAVAPDQTKPRGRPGWPVSSY